MKNKLIVSILLVLSAITVTLVHPAKADQKIDDPAACVVLSLLEDDHNGQYIVWIVSASEGSPDIQRGDNGALAMAKLSAARFRMVAYNGATYTWVR